MIIKWKNFFEIIKWLSQKCFVVLEWETCGLLIQKNSKLLIKVKYVWPLCGDFVETAFDLY